MIDDQPPNLRCSQRRDEVWTSVGDKDGRRDRSESGGVICNQLLNNSYGKGSRGFGERKGGVGSALWLESDFGLVHDDLTYNPATRKLPALVLKPRTSRVQVFDQTRDQWLKDLGVAEL